MFNHDNIYYFPENIDVRSCPKNASASVKQFHIELVHAINPRTTLMQDMKDSNREKHSGGITSYRWKEVLKQADYFDLPFRKESIRFALKRDPIERFKSVVEMLQAAELFAEQNEVPRTELYPPDKQYRLYASVTELLNDLEDGKVTEAHFWTQTYYLGDKKLYDYIYDVDDFAQFQRQVLWLNNIEWDQRRWYIHVNISDNTSKDRLEKIKETKHRRFSTVKRYGENKNFITHKMTAKDFHRVKKLYQIDYDNGWC